MSDRICSVDGCQDKWLARGMCSKHYQRAKYRGEIKTAAHDRHGGRHTGTYATWSAMRNRCEKPKDKMYHRYGGRGIKVCDRWKSFRNFRDDMGERKDGMSIDRIDASGDYCPENCRWVPLSDQNRNKQNTAWLTIYGKTMSRAEWHEIVAHEVTYSAIKLRQKRGWTDKEAVFGKSVSSGGVA